MRFVQPKVFLVGYSTVSTDGLLEYLRYTNNQQFIADISEAKAQGLSDGEILCSFFAKVCYASLTLGKNKNVEKTRGIGPNLKNAFDQGHGSVFEHASLNFIATDVSRVFTHELVRHRVGTAFSQTSGRYVRGDDIGFVFDPILEPVQATVVEALGYIEAKYKEACSILDGVKDFDTKKKLTSALRRILPNGQNNEIGFSVNLRALRHTVQVRTSSAAEWEIRNVFNQVYQLTRKKFPLLYYGATEAVLSDGSLEISGMTLQPYESKR